MSNLRRFFKKGDVVFITIATFNRNKIIIEIIAHVYIHDHIHILVNVRENDLIRMKMSGGHAS